MEKSKPYTNDNGDVYWYLKSAGIEYLHRLDGPAVECVDGKNYWFVNDEDLDTNEVENWIKENDIDLTQEEHVMAFKLRWC